MSTSLEERIVACRRCARLIDHCEQVAREKRRMYRDEDYWGRPVPTFGRSTAPLIVVGLAPGAHGANRTGRVFTGDSSGDWLYRAMHAAGFANQPESTHRGDGLRLKRAAVTCAVHCAPPGNKPNSAERDACLPYLVEELTVGPKKRVVLALGRFGFEAVLRAWPDTGRGAFTEKPQFGHGSEATTEDGRVTLLASYHPSRQNTQTGRLTQEMFQGPFDRARDLLGASR